MNSPDSLVELYGVATKEAKDKEAKVYAAELIREVGLKCIGFNGVSWPSFNTKFLQPPILTFIQVPRTINSLGAFRAGLPSDIVSALSTTPNRYEYPSSIH